MQEFADILSFNLDRPVVDKTGLTGVYEFKVELDVNVAAARMIRGLGRDGTSVNEPSGVSTFDAVSGLGLRLQDTRAPLPFVVVDDIARTPAPN